MNFEISKSNFPFSSKYIWVHYSEAKVERYGKNIGQ